MELSGYFAILRRWWWTLIVAVWVAGLAGYIVGSQIPPTYETQARLLVGPINTDIDTLRAAGQLVQTYSVLTTSQPLLDSVTRELGLSMSNGELRARIRATADDVTRLLTIRVTDENPERAVEIASTLSDELIQLAAGGTTRPEGELQTVDFPEIPTAPVAPQLSLIVLLAALGGLVTAVVVIVLIEYVSDAARGHEDLQRLVPGPFLGSAALEESLTARSLRRLPADGPTSATYRQLLPKLEYAAGRKVRAIAVFGPPAQPEATDAVVALALAMGDVSPRVTIVDPSGQLSDRLGIGGERGLRDWLEDPSQPLEPLAVELAPHVTVLPSGGGPVERLTVDETSRLRDLLLRNDGSIVISAGSPEEAPPGLSTASQMDAVLIVAVRDRTRRAQLRRLVDDLRQVGAERTASLLLEPGDRASRQRAAAVRPLEPVAEVSSSAPREPTIRTSTTRRQRRPD